MCCKSPFQRLLVVVLCLQLHLVYRNNNNRQDCTLMTSCLVSGFALASPSFSSWQHLQPRRQELFQPNQQQSTRLNLMHSRKGYWQIPRGGGSDSIHAPILSSLTATSKSDSSTISNITSSNTDDVSPDLGVNQTTTTTKERAYAAITSVNDDDDSPFSKNLSKQNVAVTNNDEEASKGTSKVFKVDDTHQELPLDYNSSSVDAGGLSVSDLCRQLQLSNPKYGLTSKQAKDRLQLYGENTLKKASKKTVWQMILEQFTDRLVQILLVVAVLSSVFSYWELMQQSSIESDSLWKAFVEPLVIFAILILNAAVGVWQSSSARDSLDALQSLQPSLCTVLRNGIWQANSPAVDLVPGDVVQVRVGDKIPADARLLSLSGSSSLQVDEGSLTGESTTVSKLPGDEGQTTTSMAPIQDQRGMLFGGTMVTRGSGIAIVTQTGMSTQFGRIQQGVTEAQQETTKTPLAIKLDEFGETLTVIIGAICLAVFLVSIPKMNDPSFSNVYEGAVYYAKVAVALGVAAIPEGLPAVITLCLSLGTRRMAQRNVIVRKLQSVETLGCTSVICTDKTGTLTTNEMTAVSLVNFEHENTKGEELVVERLVQGYSYSPIGQVQGIDYNKEVREQPLGSIADIAAVSALCNDARIIGKDSTEDEENGKDIVEEVVDKSGNVNRTVTNKKSNNNKNDNSKRKSRTNKPENAKAYERVGEPTEAALCVLAEKLGGMSHFLEGSGHSDRRGLHFNVPPSVLASANVDSWRQTHQRIATLEFSRDRKSMSVLCEFPKGDFPTAAEFHDGVKPRKAGNRLLVKGAPNLLLERCTHVKFRDGTVANLGGSFRRQIEEKLSELARRPLRCLALAVKDYEELDESLKNFTPTNDSDVAHHPLLSDPANYKNVESGLTLLGIVGIKDPARPEVAQSIELCTKAGIRVLMITGDAKDTAVAIAKDVNIFPKETEESFTPLKAFEGREFFKKSEKEQLKILQSDNIVFCRAEPADKQRLVKMLQSLGEIPAMTGDGVNDAPALQQAAIGVAMGITGTEVSKEAADMILADDNFSTIVNAVEEGRRIYANMQAFICFLISCNIGEICAIFFATLAGFPEPLTAMHLLWVNLVTDGPPATALGFNPPAPDLMEQPPRPSDEPIMTRWLLTRYVITGLYVGLATIGVFAQHYLQLGVNLSQLATWSQCGEFWKPTADSLTCSELFQGSARLLPQTLALTTLVCMEMLKALSAVSVDNSLFRVGPQSNPWLLLGVSVPFALHLALLYSPYLGLPALGESFGMVPLSWDNWTTVLTWAVPILLVDEILKAIGRYRNKNDRNNVAELHKRRSHNITIP